MHIEPPDDHGERDAGRDTAKMEYRELCVLHLPETPARDQLLILLYKNMHMCLAYLAEREETWFEDAKERWCVGECCREADFEYE